MESCPETKARENMRRHVQSMRSRRRNPGVRARSRQSPRRKFLVVAGMNQVVDDSRVVGIRAAQRLQQRGRLLLAEMGLIGGRRIGQQGESIKHLNLNVLPVLLRECLHGAFVSQSAGRVRRRGVPKHQGQCLDQSPFPIRSPADLPRQPDFFRPFRHPRWRQRRVPKLVEPAHGSAPVGDRAPWVAFCHCLENFSRRLVRKGMEQGHASHERIPNPWRTGNVEGNLAELLRRRVAVGFLGVQTGRKEQRCDTALMRNTQAHAGTSRHANSTARVRESPAPG
jgi:hypothetical protein